MKVFVLRYDRSRQCLIMPILEFDESQRDDADAVRYEAEVAALALREDMEIVTLEAASEEDLRITHASYFRDEVPALPGI